LGANGVGQLGNGTMLDSWTDNSGVEDGYVVGYFYFDDYSYIWHFQDVAHLPANATTYRLAAFSSDGYYVAATRDGGHSDFAAFGVVTGTARAMAPRATVQRPSHVIRTPRPHP